MRRTALLTAVLAALHLTGCEGTREQKMPPFVPLPQEMQNVSVFDSPNKDSADKKPTPPHTP